MTEKFMDWCREKAAQAWCQESTKNYVITVALAEEFAKILYEVCSRQPYIVGNRKLIEELVITGKTSTPIYEGNNLIGTKTTIYASLNDNETIIEEFTCARCKLYTKESTFKSRVIDIGKICNGCYEDTRFKLDQK